MYTIYNMRNYFCNYNPIVTTRNGIRISWKTMAKLQKEYNVGIDDIFDFDD